MSSASQYCFPARTVLPSRSAKAGMRQVCVVTSDGATASGWGSEFTTMLRGDERFASSVHHYTGLLAIFPAADIAAETELLVFAAPFAVIEARATALAGHRMRGLQCPILILTDAQSEVSLLRCLEAGAMDFIPLPLRKAEVVVRLMRWSRGRSAVELATESSTQEFGLVGIIGESQQIQPQIEKVRRYCRCDATVLISGETDTGKKVFARAIHNTGLRSDAPFHPRRLSEDDSGLFCRHWETVLGDRRPCGAVESRRTILVQHAQDTEQSPPNPGQQRGVGGQGKAMNGRQIFFRFNYDSSRIIRKEIIP